MKLRLFPIIVLLLLLASCRTGQIAAKQENSSTKTVQTEPAVAATLQETMPAVTAQSGRVDWGSIPPSELFDLPWEDNSLFLKSLRSESRHWVDDLPLASRYRIELTIPEEMDVIIGQEEVVYTNQENVDLKEIIFRLFPNINGGRIEIANLQINGEPAEVQLTNEDSTMSVALKEVLAPAESVLIRMDFKLQIPREMGGNYGLFGYFDDVLMLDVFAPMIPVYDDNGWYTEKPASNGDPSFNDAGFYIVRVNAPEDFVLAASGTAVEQENDNGIQTITYAIGPARDFSLTGSRKFIVDSGSKNGVLVSSYGFPGMEDGMKLARESAQEAINLFDDLIGTYDYTEFDIAATPMQAGGIEYPGMTWVNRDYFDLKASINGIPASSMLESVTAHETGHQWFYNAVGNDQADSPWEDESLVQYITGIYYLYRYGSDGYTSYKNSWYSRWQRVDLKKMPIGLPAGDYNQTEYTAIVYGRGPFFFAELSAEMGEDEFEEFLSDYFTRYHWKISYTEDIKTVAEENCECDLTRLFEDWVYP